ncbi:MAG: hypothetical protein N3H31_01725 [Candidatus Nezhaarchaeota archaeon]|nr:hypothetical protein [Candidatus Nezhaarchaeota archaeon]
MSEPIKELAELKKYLEERISSLQREINVLKSLAKVVDEALSRDSFKQAAELLEPRRVEEGVMSVMTREGRVLGKIFIGLDSIRIEPSPELSFDVNTPPFKAFFIDKVLEAMKARDKESAERGLLDPERVMDYQVQTEGERLKCIVVKNVVDERRIREIRNAIRWTFERMLDRMKR